MPKLGLGFGGDRVDFWKIEPFFWKIEPLSFWQNLIIEDRGLKFEYSVYGIH